MSLQDPWNILVIIISIARMKYIFYNFKTSSRVVRVQQLNNKNTQQYFTLKVVLGVILAPLFFLSVFVINRSFETSTIPTIP